MQFSRWETQNIALAAIAQCAALVNSLAVRGSADPAAVAACVKPLLNFNPDSVSELFPNVLQLSLGLRTLQEIFGSDKDDRNPEVIRYLLGMLALRQKLMADPAMQEKLQSELKKVAAPGAIEQDDDFDTQELFKQVADIYQATLSYYSFRIHVKGNMEHLRNENIASQIRTLLLAGIRAAVLWYQIGGRRWHLILYRKKISQTISDIRKNLLSSV
jgi:high frequency lysogenization protein